MKDDLLKNCLDEQGRVQVWPKKQARKEAVIRYMAEKFSYGKVYTEKEVNAILDQWHTFGDYFLLRRSLIEARLLQRDAYGREYRRVSAFPHISELLERHYGLHVLQCDQTSLGAGSDTYFATCSEGKFVIKFPSTSQINHPELEIDLCRHLQAKGIPVSRFLNNTTGSALSYDADGRLFHVQHFIEGKCPALNSASSPLLKEMAEMLGKVHTALRSYPPLPVGIGEDFFRYMTPEHVLQSYEASLRIAKEKNDHQSVTDLHYRIGLMHRLPAFSFDPGKISCGNTHGDYFIRQLLCNDDHIAAVIDWTTACIHPYIWELLRSFVYGSPSCKEGTIPEDELVAYVSAYLSYAPLNDDDLAAMLPLFFCQLAVCDYYGQYYASDASNREIYLHQARFSTKLLQNMEQNMDHLTTRLLELRPQKGGAV